MLRHTSLALTLALLVSACSDGGGTMQSREQIRTSVLRDGGNEIGTAVRSAVTSRTGGDRVTGTWDGDDLTVAVAAAGSARAVSFDTETDAFGTSPAVASTVRTGHRQRTFDLGMEDDDLSTVGRVVVDWKDDDATDFVVYGYWLTVDSSGDGTPVVDAGVFAKGPEFDTAPASLPSTGMATYEGRAHGLHTVAYVPGEFGRTANEFGIGEFDGDVTLTADFGAMTVGGRIDNIHSTEESVASGSLTTSQRSSRPYVLTLGSGPIASGAFSGTVSVGGPDNIASSSGTWNGQFSSVPVGSSDDTPSGAAGTFGATWEHDGGTVGQYIGSFVAGKR